MSLWETHDMVVGIYFTVNLRYYRKLSKLEIIQSYYFLDNSRHSMKDGTAQESLQKEGALEPLCIQ